MLYIIIYWFRFDSFFKRRTKLECDAPKKGPIVYFLSVSLIQFFVVVVFSSDSKCFCLSSYHVSSMFFNLLLFLCPANISAGHCCYFSYSLFRTKPNYHANKVGKCKTRLFLNEVFSTMWSFSLTYWEKKNSSNKMDFLDRYKFQFSVSIHIRLPALIRNQTHNFFFST